VSFVELAHKGETGRNTDLYVNSFAAIRLKRNLLNNLLFFFSFILALIISMFSIMFSVNVELISYEKRIVD
jgi:hypothetical protein